MPTAGGSTACLLNQAEPKRKVPGGKGMNWEEEDWVAEEATRHRGPND